MEYLSNHQFSDQPQKGGFLSGKNSFLDFRILLLLLLFFLQGFLGNTQVKAQEVPAVVSPSTPFFIDPDNPPSCSQNNLRIIAVDFRDPNTGKTFDPNDLIGTPIGTPIDGEIYVTFAVSGQGYNFHVQYDLFIDGEPQIIDGEPQGRRALCIVVEDGNGNTVNIEDGNEVFISNFTWNYGSKVEIKNVYQTWKTGNAKPNDKSCPSTAGNSQCDYVGEGFVVETPVVANFEFETFCENRDVSFTNFSTGGEENVAFSYSWDFGDGNTSNDANPTHTYATAGTYTVTLTSTKGADSDEIQIDVTVNDPITLSINAPPAVCEPNTVDLTDPAVTSGSSAGLTYTYWLDDQATQELNNPNAVGVSGTYYIKGFNALTGCELIKPVEVSIGTCSLTLVKEATNGPIGEDCLDPTLSPIINYTFTLNNNGTFPLTNIQISDPLFEAPNPVVALTLSDDGNGDAELGVGETWVYTASYTITATDIENGQVQNQATASGDANGFTASDLSGTAVDNDTPTVVSVCQNYELTLDKQVKSGDPYSAVGNVVVYDYVITNSGNVTLDGPFSVSDDKIAGIADVNGPLAPGASVTATGSYTISQADIDAGFVTNIATASGNGVVSNSDTETVNATQTPSINIVKSASPSTYDGAGDVITYTFDVSNTGNVTLTGVTVTDPLTGLSAITPDPVTLAPGENQVFTATYTITQSDMDAGQVDNTATATGNDPDDVEVSDTDSETITVVKDASINIVKSASPSTYDGAGDVITYTFDVSNTGNVTLTGVTVTDP
ncbi:PKD domain-containing protein, partial [Algoriphagus lutimaris]|uniref:DUF7507 domain-containing protein n=1 Tax=Algoriphagus lutimaris TaxID=613197 RepID=UPI00196AA9A0